MIGLTPWAIAAVKELAVADTSLFACSAGQYTFKIFQTSDSIWIKASLPRTGQIAFRAYYSPGDTISIVQQESSEATFTLVGSSVYGKFQIHISVTDAELPVLRYTTSITPARDLHMPFNPRDILVLNGEKADTKGDIHASQWGTRSGFMYMSMTQPKSSSVLYLQNLSALSPYCDQTKSTVADSVGGTWPEIGFALPASTAPLKAHQEVTISDALVAFNTEVPQDEFGITQRYLNMLAHLYVLLPKPETHYQDWPEIVEKGLADLSDNPGCWMQADGHQYLNAYVSDYDTPPEIMVQLAVLLPLVDYVEWSGTTFDIMQTIKKGLPAFYSDKLKTITRWLPAAEDQLEGEEEQKSPGVMDSWYLHHPLLNLSRLALKEDHVAKELFLNSIEFAITVAKHFNYKWPVFYKMDTLEVVKAETAEGMGGEKDVAGLYAHVMLQAYELTGEKRFLTESEKAAKTLKGLGFSIFYQANNTAFAAGAMLRLYKITGKELYLNISYMCLAGIFRNTQLWDCNYGYGKHFPKFFSLYPLNDAPYTAAYEEQEVFCAAHDYLKHAEGIEILPSVKLLLAEFIRYLVDRAIYYYPPMLPAEMLEEKPKVGELDPSLWIALEDLQDGWLKSGTVGQEVYGAGNAFGILPRHYLKVPDEDFMIYVDYPTANFTARMGQNIHFSLLGDNHMKCRMMILKKGRSKLPVFEVRAGKSPEVIPGTKVAGGNIEYSLCGDQKISISWNKIAN